MPMGSDHVCLLGKTGSDRRTVKVTRLTQFGHLAWIKTGLSNGYLVEVKGNLKPGEQIITKVVYFLTAPHPGASAVVQK
jgi:hypothetical protein